MYKKVKLRLLFMCSFIVFQWLVGISPATSAQEITTTYRLDNVQLLPDTSHPWMSSQQMTGSFEWTYEEGDFENGSGRFIDLDVPWYGSGLESLDINIDLTSIEFVLPGNYHDLGLDITLFLLEPLSPDQSVAIDTVRSKFEIQHGISYMGRVVSGSIVLGSPPVPDIDANGSDGPVVIHPGDNLNVTLALDPGGHSGVISDWWIFIFHYNQDTGSLTPVFNTGFQSPLFNLPPTTFISTTGFPAGTFLFFLGIDMVPNGVLDESQLFGDIVPVFIE